MNKQTANNPDQVLANWLHNRLAKCLPCDYWQENELRDLATKLMANRETVKHCQTCERFTSSLDRNGVCPDCQ